MKTAVSVPDDLFREAESTAKQLKISRSKLYTKALTEYLERHSAESITKRLNEYYSKHPSKADPAFLRATLLSIDEW